MIYTPANEVLIQYMRDIAAALNSGTAGGAQKYALVPASASNQVIKNSPGLLVRAIVTATGTTNALIYDNASTATGNVIGVIPSTATVGQSFIFEVPTTNGATVAGATTNPALIVTYA